MVIPIYEPKSKGTINISITIMVLHSLVGWGLFFPIFCLCRFSVSCLKLQKLEQFRFMSDKLI